VCIGKITLDEYQKQIDRIALFLSGKTAQVKKDLVLEMQKLAKNKKFETAARLRDQIRALQLLEEKQMVILTKKVSWDVVSFAQIDNFSCINLFKVREGKLVDKENFVYEITSPNPSFERRGISVSIPPLAGGRLEPVLSESRMGGVMQSFLEKYYTETTDLPKEIYLEKLPENISIIELLLKERARKKIKIIEPKKSKPLELVKLGKENAQEYLKKYLIDQGKYLDDINKALNQLKEILHLENIPKRIECFDISNIQGTNAVGSMVVFVDGLPKKSDYRKFKIHSKDTPDDFSMMRETLERRFIHSQIDIKSEARNPKHEINPKSKILNLKSEWPVPDLIVIDGGKGQLSAALLVLQKFKISNLKFQIIGLAKRIEEIFVPNKSQPIILDHDQPALKLLQRIRDEAHRFGITFHRSLRSKQAIKSALDDIPGIGPKTKKLLKQRFGSIRKIKNATLEELNLLIGKSLAKKIKFDL
jgi:excinuclease ABC subunit C